jgi:hypothetical protein
MTALLKGDAHAGIENSYLLASGSGARLYPHVGYERIGTLLVFTKVRS